MKKSFNIPEKYTIYFIPIAFVIFNLIWKFLSINVLPIDHDEPFTIFYSQMSITKMYKHLSEGENNPLFFECILHFWTKLFGISTFSVRFLSVLFSSATVYFIYQLCRKNFSSTTAIIASVIFSASNYHLGFSHEARTYAMFAFFVTVSMYVFFEFIKQPTKRNIWLLGIINILLVYSHFFALFIPFVQLISCLIRKDLRKNVLLKFLLSCLITFIGYSPMFFMLMNRFFTSLSKGTWLGPTNINELFYMLEIFANNKMMRFFSILIVALAIVSYLIKEKSIKISTPTFVIITWFVLPLSIMFIVSLEKFPYTVPMFLDRYLIHTSIPFFILMAIALSYIGKLIPFKAASLLLFGIFSILMFSSMRWPVDNNKMPEIVQTVNKYKTDKTIVYLAPQYYILNFCSNYNPSCFKNVSDEEPFENLLKQLSKDKIYGIYNYHGLKKDLLEENNRVIYIDIAAKFLYSDNSIIDSLQVNAVRSEKFALTDSRDVWVFDY